MIYVNHKEMGIRIMSCSFSYITDLFNYQQQSEGCDVRKNAGKDLVVDPGAFPTAFGRITARCGEPSHDFGTARDLIFTSFYDDLTISTSRSQSLQSISADKINTVIVSTTFHTCMSFRPISEPLNTRAPKSNSLVHKWSLLFPQK